jgi:hypothetical protein
MNVFLDMRVMHVFNRSCSRVDVLVRLFSVTNDQMTNRHKQARESERERASDRKRVNDIQSVCVWLTCHRTWHLVLWVGGPHIVSFILCDWINRVFQVGVYHITM